MSFMKDVPLFGMMTPTIEHGKAPSFNALSPAFSLLNKNHPNKKTTPPGTLINSSTKSVY